MTKYKKQTVSDQSTQEAQAITKGTQKPGQTKEQSKLIAQGIAKGIEQYKKQQKSKAREKDKQRKKQARQEDEALNNEVISTQQNTSFQTTLPWGLLVISWIGFTIFYLMHS